MIGQIYGIYISYFGCPKMFLSSNGGEFENRSFTAIEYGGIPVTTTAGESPFGDGTVKRYNKRCRKHLMMLNLNWILHWPGFSLVGGTGGTPHELYVPS